MKPTVWVPLYQSKRSLVPALKFEHCYLSTSVLEGKADGTHGAWYLNLVVIFALEGSWAQSEGRGQMHTLHVFGLCADPESTPVPGIKP